MTARWSDPHRLPAPPTGSENAAAHRLGLSHSTVKHHLANARSKVGATTTAQLVWILAARLPGPEGSPNPTKDDPSNVETSISNSSNPQTGLTLDSWQRLAQTASAGAPPTRRFGAPGGVHRGDDGARAQEGEMSRTQAGSHRGLVGLMAAVFAVSACAGPGTSESQVVAQSPTPTATSGQPTSSSLPSSSLPTASCAADTPPSWVRNASNPNDGLVDPRGRIVFGQIHRETELGQILQPLFAIDPDGSDLVQLLDCEVARPRFSRDGSHLAFAVIAGDGWQIATSAADGSNMHVLTALPKGTDPDKTGQPDWSPDGSRIVFAASAKLWRMDADGSNLEPLGVSVFDAEPRFSPDGASIVFLRGDFAKGISEPWIRDLATGSERSLLAGNHRELEHADWSPDGRWIIYNTLTDATGAHVEQIERVPVDDPKAIPEVVYGRADDFAFKPTYSPDGASILFGCHESVCLMNADGSKVSVLVSVPDAHLNHFAWGVSTAHP